MRRWEREMDRLFGNTEFFAPAVEVERKNNTFSVKAELPGMKMEDIKVEVNDDGLVIEGERKHEAKTEKEGYFRTECSYGHFRRVIPLPEGAKAENAQAKYNNGMLEVTVPVAEAKKTVKKIPVSQA
jgi:HSP20 family protein